MSNKEKNVEKKVKNNTDKSVKKSDKKLGEVTIDPKLKSELIDENVAELKEKEVNESNKPKKDVSKGVKGIIVVVFIFLILFLVSKILSNNQERLLNKAVNELASKNVVSTNFNDEKINTTGEYKVVAETIKEFLVKYSAQMKEVQLYK